MDLQAVVNQFFNEKGEITLRPELTLAGMCEVVYQIEKKSGAADRNCLRFWDFSESRDGVAVDYSRDQINTRIKAVAARLQQVATVGDRAVILANNSPDYIFAMLGAMYAGVVPIPLYDPNEPGHGDHLRAVIGDAEPKVVLTNSRSAAAVREFFADVPGKQRPRVLSVDSLPDSLAESWQNPLFSEANQILMARTQSMPVDLPAFLLYTSGSTRVPAGVMLTNRSIMTNVLQIFTAAKLQTPLRLVTWLPLHHNMGIILATFVTILGLDMELMAPRDFIQQPSRWLKQLATREDDVNVYTVIPNFALDLAVRYGLPEVDDTLDFSAIDGLIIGSEPVSEKAVTSFYEAFSKFGLKREVLRPSYGMAEATLLISTPQTETRPVFVNLDREKLAAGEAVLVEKGENSATFASVGQTVRPQYLTIVDPETRAELPENAIGEIWVHGGNKASGYLGRFEETEEAFHNSLASRLSENSRAEDAPDHEWLATGDLGVIIDNELYITGRIKDLVIIAGRNHYPQDIEYTANAASEHIRPDSVAAFAVEGDDVEKLIIFAERGVNQDESGDAAAIEAIRAAVTEAHGIVPFEIRIMAPGEVARSSAGKIARRVNKKKYLEG